MNDSAKLQNQELQKRMNQEYKYGFVTDVETDSVAPGLSEDVVRLISRKKEEPEWLLDFRLKALHRFEQMLEHEQEPEWATVDHPKID